MGGRTRAGAWRPRESVPVIITEILAQIGAPHFTAGIVLWQDRVVEAAPIVGFMKKWSRGRVRDYCAGKGWVVSVVHQMDRQRTYQGLDDK